MKLISVDKLEEGMILAEDLMNEDGVIYLNTGVEIKRRHKNLLRNLGVDFVYVKIAKGEMLEPEKIVPVPRNDKRDYTQEFKQTLKTFKNMYTTVKLGGKVMVNEMSESLDPLVEGIVNHNDILGSLRMIEVRDEYTYKHSINVSLISSMIGKWLGYSTTELKNLSIAGMLHDIGKCKVPDNVLNKPGKLTDVEFEVMKSHAMFGYDILREAEHINDDILYGVLQHHEKIDGTGYPGSTKGRNIHEFAKIIAIADVFDAMTSTRVYKPKISPFKVAEEILTESYSHLDVNIANVFLKNIASFYVGNNVRLNTGEIGEIIMVNRFAVTRPLVKTSLDFYDLSKDYKVDILEVL